jgi:hypothetical protein
MPSWKFTDDYGSQYPALSASILNLLVFSDHSIAGQAFTGTLDVASSGASLGTLGPMVGLTFIGVSGQVSNAAGTLTVTLASNNDTAIRDGLASTIPILGPKIITAAVAIATTVTPKDNADEGPLLDEFNLSVTLPIGNASFVLTCPVPMHGGLFTVEGTFSHAGVTLDDVAFLMGKLSSGNEWFPSADLKPYLDKGPALSLLGISVTLYATLSPLSIVVSSVSVGIGIVGIPLMNQKLYLTPLGVWPTVEDPLGEDASVVWGVIGGLALCNYQHPGDYEHPDLALELAMDLTNYTFSASLDNPNNVSINTVLQDLLGQGTSVGLPTELTVNAFNVEVSADKASGELQSFAADIAMSGGFGLFQNLDIEEISIAVAYSA